MKIELRVLGPNQTEVCLGRNMLFFSYGTVVAALIGQHWHVTDKKHSRTTKKHINRYFGEFKDFCYTPQEYLEAMVDKLV